MYAGSVSGNARSVLRMGLLACMVAVLAACAPRPVARVAPPDDTAKEQVIYVATQRDLNRTGPVFGEARGQGLNQFRLTVSVPPGHQTGLIEWPDKTPDAATDFVIIDTKILASSRQMADEMRKARTNPETLVFIHGYNNTLSEAVYRFAQIKTDFEIDEPSVLFSWPSAGDPRGYIYDRDSILFARDDLRRTLDALTAQRGDQVFLVGHSMGALLVMEVLRQAALSGDRQLLSQISGVVLMSPDIDPDLFRKQAEAIGKLPQPFLIFTSRQDRVLGLVAWLAGRKPRLGVIDGPEKVAGLEVQVIDFTALGDGEGLNHSVPVTSPSAVGVLRGMIAQAEENGGGFEDYLVLEAVQ